MGRRLAAIAASVVVYSGVALAALTGTSSSAQSAFVAAPPTTRVGVAIDIIHTTAPLPTTTSTTTTTTSTTTTTTTTPPTTAPSPTGWPNAANTGPDGTLATWAGSCTLSTPFAIIEDTQFNCDVQISATNVTIRNSSIDGTVRVLSTGSGFVLEDSYANGHAGVGTVEAAGGASFTVLRSEIVGGNRGVWCNNCLVQDSWMHGNETLPGDHASAVRADQYSTIIHNTLHCDVIGNCSADQTGYPDFQPTHHWTIENNFYVASSAWYCAYGGATGGKPYSTHPDTATYIQYRNNVFDRGVSGRCGEFGGWVITNFNAARTGNVWTGNRWSDGTVVNP